MAQECLRCLSRASGCLANLEINNKNLLVKGNFLCNLSKTVSGSLELLQIVSETVADCLKNSSDCLKEVADCLKNVADRLELFLDV